LIDDVEAADTLSCLPLAALGVRTDDHVDVDSAWLLIDYSDNVADWSDLESFSRSQAT
jgi:hypothetical protein